MEYAAETGRDLQKMNRQQLLELMLEQREKIDALEKELERTRQELENRRIVEKNAGSIANAALALNKVFEAAQEAADQYILSVRANAEEEKAKRASAPRVKRQSRRGGYSRKGR